MKNFMDENFLLTTDTARELYHDVAAGLPICDFHCHLPPSMIAQNKPYRSITEAMLGGDHYKWRLMRIAGIPERLITGDAPDLDKFKAFAGVVQYAIGNPLYHWTHLELQRYFGIYEPLTADNAEYIFNKCNELLAEGMRPQEIISRGNVAVVGTTDDPIDDLRWHELLADPARNESGARILPSFRPDKALNITGAGFSDYIHALGGAAGRGIHAFHTLKHALAERIDYFNKRGCRVSDHGLETVPYSRVNESKADAALKHALAGTKPTDEQAGAYRASLLAFLAHEYDRLGWTMCLHIGAIRNINPAMFDRFGPDVGCDAMHDMPVATPLAALLGEISLHTKLPRTLLFSLHDKDNYALAVTAGGLQRDGVASHIGLGPPWWYHDQRDGMVKHMRELAAVSAINEFVGMTTDSRSLLSYTRHEYFRRIFCNQLGEWVENGEFPGDMAALGEIVRRVCYENAARMFA